MIRSAQVRRSVELTRRETFVDGIDHAEDAFVGVLRRDDTGKTVVRL